MSISKGNIASTIGASTLERHVVVRAALESETDTEQQKDRALIFT